MADTHLEGIPRPQTSYAPEKFTPEVYQRIMSGKPCYAGADLVVTTLDDVSIGALAEGRLERESIR